MTHVVPITPPMWCPRHDHCGHYIDNVVGMPITPLMSLPPHQPCHRLQIMCHPAFARRNTPTTQALLRQSITDVHFWSGDGDHTTLRMWRVHLVTTEVISCPLHYECGAHYVGGVVTTSSMWLANFLFLFPSPTSPRFTCKLWGIPEI